MSFSKIPPSTLTGYIPAWAHILNDGTLVICSDITRIPANAFVGQTGFKKIIFSSVPTSICDGAFKGCTGLVDLNLPDGVKTIGNGAFEGCTGLVNIQLPESLVSIGEKAFVDCPNLNYRPHIVTLVTKGKVPYVW